MRSLSAAVVLFALAACGGEPATPEGVCKHMLDLVKQMGKTPPDESRIMTECVAEQKEMEKKHGAETYKKVASCIVAAKDVLTMVGCEQIAKGKPPGGAEAGKAAFDEYASKSKSIEARVQLRMLTRDAAGVFAETAQYPEPSAGPVPALGTCCKQPDGKCAPDPALWAAEPWTSLQFSMDDPHLYSYEYKVDNAARKATVFAYGDLDCDGTYSTFSMSVDSPVDSKPEEKDPLE